MWKGDFCCYRTGGGLGLRVSKKRMDDGRISSAARIRSRVISVKRGQAESVATNRSKSRGTNSMTTNNASTAPTANGTRISVVAQNQATGINRLAKATNANNATRMLTGLVGYRETTHQAKSSSRERVARRTHSTENCCATLLHIQLGSLRRRPL